MFIIKMGDEACGPTFDGLNTDQIVTQAPIESSNYVATNSANQYATTASNMDIVAAATLPTFSFKNSAGNITGTLQAAKVALFANSEMTTTGVVALTAQTTNNTAVNIKNDSVDAALLVGKMTPLTEKGLGMQVTTQSVDKAALALTNTTSSTATLLQALAPNMPFVSKANILIGKDNSITGNSYTMGMYYTSNNALNRLEFNSFGDATAIMQMFKRTTASTSASTGSVVCGGDLTSFTRLCSKALVLYGSTSGSATIQSSAITTTPYTLTLPNSLGTNGQYLTLGNPVGNVAPLSWTTGAGANPTQSAIVGRLLTATQNIATSTQVPLLYDSSDGQTNLGTVPISYNAANGRFTNTFGNTTSFLVAYHTAFSGNATGFRQTWIEKNGQNTIRYGQNSIASAGAGLVTIVSGAAYITIANGEFFTLFAYQTSGATLDLFNNVFDASRVQITQVPGSTVPQVNAALLGYRAGGAQSTTTSLGTPVTFSSLDFNVGSTGLTFNGTTTFTNTTGGTLNLLVTAGATFESNATGLRYIWIAVNSLGGRQGQVIEQAVTGDITALSTSVQVSIPNADFIRVFVLQTSGVSLLLTTATAVQFSPIVSSSALQSVTLTSPSPLLSISGSPAVGQNPTLSFTTTSTPTGTGTEIVLSTSPTITTPTINTPTITGLMNASSIACTSVQTNIVKGVLQFLETYATMTQFSGNNITVTMTSAFSTNLVLNHNFTGCKIILPNATTLLKGNTYRFNNNGSSTNTEIYANDGTTLIGTSNWQTYIIVILDDNSTANGVWDIHGMLRNSAVSSSNLGLELKNGALISLANTANFKVSTYTSPSQSVNYNWIYPTTAGSSGQVLTSSGGSTLTWSSPLTANTTLNLNGAGHVFGASYPDTLAPTLSIYSENDPALNAGPGTLKVDCLSTGTTLVASFLNSNQTANTLLFTALGRALSFGNSCTPGFNYYGSNNNQNHYSISLYGKSPSVKVFSDSTVATTNQASLIVNGGTTTESLYVNGDTTLQATTTTTLTTNSITILPNPGQPRQLTFDYGTSTPTFWWGKTFDTDPDLSVSYPATIGASSLPNRTYAWQQVGRTYSFTMNFQVDIAFYSNTYPAIFINDIFPPIPSYYTQSATSGNGEGIYIPCQYLF